MRNIESLFSKKDKKLAAETIKNVEDIARERSKEENKYHNTMVDANDIPKIIDDSMVIGKTPDGHTIRKSPTKYVQTKVEGDVVTTSPRFGDVKFYVRRHSPKQIFHLEEYLKDSYLSKIMFQKYQSKFALLAGKKDPLLLTGKKDPLLDWLIKDW